MLLIEKKTFVRLLIYAFYLLFLSLMVCFAIVFPVKFLEWNLYIGILSFFLMINGTFASQARRRMTVQQVGVPGVMALFVLKVGCALPYNVITLFRRIIAIPQKSLGSAEEMLLSPHWVELIFGRHAILLLSFSILLMSIVSGRSEFIDSNMPTIVITMSTLFVAISAVKSDLIGRNGSLPFPRTYFTISALGYVLFIYFYVVSTRAYFLGEEYSPLSKENIIYILTTNYVDEIKKIAVEVTADANYAINLYNSFNKNTSVDILNLLITTTAVSSFFSSIYSISKNKASGSDVYWLYIFLLRRGYLGARSTILAQIEDPKLRLKAAFIENLMAGNSRVSYIYADLLLRLTVALHGDISKYSDFTIEALLMISENIWLSANNQELVYRYVLDQTDVGEDAYYSICLSIYLNLDASRRNSFIAEIEKKAPFNHRYLIDRLELVSINTDILIANSEYIYNLITDSSGKHFIAGVISQIYNRCDWRRLYDVKNEAATNLAEKIENCIDGLTQRMLNNDYNYLDINSMECMIIRIFILINNDHHRSSDLQSLSNVLSDVYSLVDFDGGARRNVSIFKRTTKIQKDRNFIAKKIN